MKTLIPGNVTESFIELGFSMDLLEKQQVSGQEIVAATPSFHCSGKCTMSCGKTMACTRNW